MLLAGSHAHLLTAYWAWLFLHCKTGLSRCKRADGAQVLKYILFAHFKKKFADPWYRAYKVKRFKRRAEQITSSFGSRNCHLGRDT